MKYNLSTQEIYILRKIAKKSKMDCWFEIRITTQDIAKIFDKENRKYLILKNGIGDLYEAMTSYEDYDLAQDEINIFENLLQRLKIKLKR